MSILQKRFTFTPAYAYLLLPLLAYLSYFASRGQDGNAGAFLMGLIILAPIYCLVMIVGTRRVGTWHSLAHLFVFPITCWIATTYDSHLIEMSGMWVFVFPFFTALMVVLGALCVLIAAAFRKGTANPEICQSCGYNVRGNQSGICPGCGTHLPTPDVRHIKPSFVTRMNAAADVRVSPWHLYLLAPMYFLFGLGVPKWTDWGGVVLGCVFPLVFLIQAYLSVFAFRRNALNHVVIQLIFFLGTSWCGAQIRSPTDNGDAQLLFVVWGLTATAVFASATVATIANMRRNRAVKPEFNP